MKKLTQYILIIIFKLIFFILFYKMTKIALCISGQPRNAIETFPLIYENIIIPNNADVFIHMNFDSNNTYIENSFGTETNKGRLIDRFETKRKRDAKTEEEINRLCHFTNLQPLWSTENYKKGKKIL